MSDPKKLTLPPQWNEIGLLFKFWDTHKTNVLLPPPPPPPPPPLIQRLAESLRNFRCDFQILTPTPPPPPPPLEKILRTRLSGYNTLSKQF